MKKNLILLLLFFSSSLFAECEPQRAECESRLLGREMFTYVEIGGAALFVGQKSETSPAIGIGRRYCTPYSAIDVSFHILPGDNGVFLYSTPRILYLHYFEPEAFNSLYAGGGLSYSGMKGAKQKDSEGEKIERKSFNGVAAELVLGYEFCRQSYLRPFAQITLTQALIATNRKGDFPSPAIAAYLGAGF